MAAVVFGHLHKLLVDTKNVKRYEPPEMHRVIKESVSVHVFSMIMASLVLIPVSWIPKATPVSGCEAYPEDGSTGQLLFYWLFFMPLTSLIPTLYVTALCFNIWWRDLLPVNGKSRSLLFFFARLLLVIYVVVLAVIISFVFGGWVQAIAFIVFNLVGFFSVCMALLKKDIWKCWKQMWTCQCPDGLDDSEVRDVEEGLRVRRNVSKYSIFYAHLTLSAHQSSVFQLSIFISLRGSMQSMRNLVRVVPVDIQGDSDSPTISFKEEDQESS